MPSKQMVNHVISQSSVDEYHFEQTELEILRQMCALLSSPLVSGYAASNLVCECQTIVTKMIKILGNILNVYTYTGHLATQSAETCKDFKYMQTNVGQNK